MSKQKPSRSGSRRPIENRRELLEPPAQVAALAGGGFQQAADLQAARLGVDFVKRPSDLPQAGLFAAGRVGAGMGHDKWNPQRLGPVQLGDELIDRIAPEPAVGAGKIDQVAVMGDRVGDAKAVAGRFGTARPARR